ncbi:hypothetical protein D3C85_1266310 [compost metagenome]
MGAGVAAQCSQLLFDRLRVDVAHQFADVLQLAALGPVGGNFLEVEQRDQQAVVQIHFLQFGGRQFGQCAADVLQRIHVAFALRFAGR